MIMVPVKYGRYKKPQSLAAFSGRYEVLCKYSFQMAPNHSIFYTNCFTTIISDLIVVFCYNLLKWFIYFYLLSLQYCQKS
jgi:hypothetical protein